MTGLDPAALRLGVSLAIGLLIGLERERRKSEGPDRAPAGIRTFALVSLTGGICMLLPGQAALAVSAVFIGGLAALGYWRSRSEDPGITTEVALLVAFLLGALAIIRPELASGVAVTVTVLLASRTRLHLFVRKVLSEQEVQDLLLFATAALVVLPLTPDRAIDPFGVLNPRTIWRLVVLVMAIGGVSYVALRALGPRFGLPMAGFASGFVSSAATIAAMGARAKSDPALCRAAAAGAVFSTVATIVQMAVVLFAVRIEVLRAMAWPLLFAGTVAVLYGGFVALRAAPSDASDFVRPGRVFDLRTALLLALVLTFALVVSAMMTNWLGQRGLILASALGGFADAHAAGVSAASLVVAGRITAQEAVLPILVGLSTNSLTKIFVAATTGTPTFALETIPGIVLVQLAAWAGYWIGG